MSDNPKARNSTSKKDSETQEKNVDIKRLLNVGKEVELSFGTFTVRELDVFALISVVSEGLEAFVNISSGEGASELDIIRSIGRDKEFQKQVAKILALFCGSDDYSLFEKPSVKDFCLLVKTIKEVVDFAEIKEAFFELGLQKYLNLSPNSTENRETTLETMPTA